MLLARCALLIAGALIVTPLQAQDDGFGDDSGEYPFDGECDDRRFFGPGMSGVFSWEALGRDATDCRRAFSDGQIRLWVQEDSLAATQCALIDWGADTGEFPNDGECDDPRFEGRATDGVLLADDVGRDATDCRRACEFGLIGLRNY